MTHNEGLSMAEQMYAKDLYNELTEKMFPEDAVNYLINTLL